MFNSWFALSSVVAYIVILFIIALIVEKNIKKGGKNLANNPYVYALAIAIYCTTWTYYGNVGLSVNNSFLFLPVYLGPTLAIIFWWQILRRFAKLKQEFRITSIADFLSVRYGKSETVGFIATIIILIGIMPYIALQLKAMISSFQVFVGGQESLVGLSLSVDLVIVILMIAFTIVFGFRQIDSSERHPGMVISVALQSLIQLVAFMAVGIFVVYFLFNGFGDIFSQISNNLDFSNLKMPSYSLWLTYFFLSMSAIMFLPRQFHIAVIENSDEKHIRTAMWMFPIYMFLITIFVIPIAIGGILKGLSLANVDTFTLLIPMQFGSSWLSLLVFIGGFSAAASMIMISSMSMATMTSNHVLLPLVERIKFLSFLKKRLLQSRWFIVTLIIFGGYLFQIGLGDSYVLVQMGMISFAAAIQFAPAMLLGLFWKNGNKLGAIMGLSGGFFIWFYTALIPAFIKSGWMPQGILNNGLFGLSFLKPEALFGITNIAPLTHTLIISMLVNIGLYVIFSLVYTQSKEEESISNTFVEVVGNDFSPVSIDDMQSKKYIILDDKKKIVSSVLNEYFSKEKSLEIIELVDKNLNFCDETKISIVELANFHNEVERILSGYLGAPSAKSIIDKSGFFSEDESKELSQYFGKVIAQLKLSPKELNEKISFYREREKLLKKQSEELEGQVEDRTKSLKKKDELLININMQLEESESMYDLIIMSTGQLIYDYDLKDGNIFWKGAINELTGSDPKDFVCNITQWGELIHPDDKKIVFEELEKARINDTPYYGVYRLKQKNNTYKYVSNKGFFVKNFNNEKVKMLGAIADITISKEYEIQLKDKNKKLKELDKQKDAFISIAAHELKTPLTSIKGFAQLMENSKIMDDKAKMNTYLNLINQNTERLYKLVIDLVDSSRISLGKIKIDKADVDLYKIIKEIDANMSIIIEKKGLKAIFSIEENIPNIFTDSDRLLQILKNLLINALHFTDNGEISLSIKKVDNRDEVIFRVSDTGQGIPKEYQELIFSKFYQVDSSLKRKVGGSGLGLSVCKGLVELMNGKIWVKSEEGVGSDFYFTLPYK